MQTASTHQTKITNEAPPQRMFEENFFFIKQIHYRFQNEIEFNNYLNMEFVYCGSSTVAVFVVYPKKLSVNKAGEMDLEAYETMFR